jgi:hypothetical protein
VLAIVNICSLNMAEGTRHEDIISIGSEEDLWVSNPKL